MIETFFSADTLNSGAGFLTAFIVGLLFGLVLEQAGFGSSRRIIGVFYFRDMAVIKVMFTALLTGAIGLTYASKLGLTGPDTFYVMPTIYGAHIIGGLIFGVIYGIMLAIMYTIGALVYNLISDRIGGLEVELKEKG